MSASDRIFAAMTALALLAPFANAQGASVRIDGIGAAECRKVTADFKIQPTIVATALVHWSYGYITRRNVERGLANQSQVDIAKATNDEKLLKVILRTCEDQPGLRVFQVVDALYEVILEKGTLSS